MKALPSWSTEESYVSNPCPAKALLSAVLERAYRDLHCTNYNDFVSAYRWALPDKELYLEDDISGGISFKHCVEILELSPYRISVIKNAALRYVKYIDNPELFKQERLEVIPIPQYNKESEGIWRRGHRVQT